MRLQLLVAAAQEAARKAGAETGGPVRRWATVQSVTGSLATVLVDGDDNPITAQVIIKLPTVSARVLVEFERGAVRVVGIQGGFS